MVHSVQVLINGETREVPDGLTVTGLLAHLSLSGNRVAIERNLDRLPWTQWGETLVSAGDRFEIVHLVGGG